MEEEEDGKRSRGAFTCKGKGKGKGVILQDPRIKRGASLPVCLSVPPCATDRRIAVVPQGPKSAVRVLLLIIIPSNRGGSSGGFQ